MGRPVSNPSRAARKPAGLVLTVAGMVSADALTIQDGRFDGYTLMRNAGAAVAGRCLAGFGSASRFAVLCGPGNNGGDGYVVARLLANAGHTVDLFADGEPRAASDAARAAADCPIRARTLGEFQPAPGMVVIDALYGAGLTRGLAGEAAIAARACRDADLPVIAVDLPSGVAGDSGQVTTVSFDAILTVTFAAPKPAHLLQPGRRLCGEVVVADIGIEAATIAAAAGDGPLLFENHPGLWQDRMPRPDVDTHKYRRGHVAVVSGGPHSTGAARLSAIAAARSGAGAVTVLSPGNSMAVNAAHLTSIMLRRADTVEEVAAFASDRSPGGWVFGPGLDPTPQTARFLVGLVEARQRTPATLVVDAGGLTAAAHEPSAFFAAGSRTTGRLVLTPHQGEFARLFPDLASDGARSKIDRARDAADRAGAVVVFKGPDTVIAAPDGRAAINVNGVPWLATAGSGDVLAGVIAGFASQGMAPFDAACAAVWMHAEAAARFGPGLIAEDLPIAIVPVLQDLLGWPLREPFDGVSPINI